MFNYSILQVIELFPKYLLPPLNISIIIKTLETQLHLSLEFKKSPTIICSETPLYLIRFQCTTKMKSIRGFCIAKDVKVSRMIILQKCARVPNTSEWREDLNVSHFESPYDFCFRSYKILGVKKKMMYRSRNLGLILFHRFELFKH